MESPDDPGDRPAWAPPSEQHREQRSTVWITVIVFALFMALMLVAAVLVAGGLKESKAGAVQTRQPTVSPSSTAVTSVTPPTSQADVPTRKYETAANPLVAPGVTMPKVTCELPKLRGTKEQLEAFYRALIPCLERAWHPALTQVGEPRIPVSVNADDVGNTACGPPPPPGEASGFYCSDGTTIFVPLPRQLEDGGPYLLDQLFLLAHEYGHHVQEQSGILSKHDVLYGEAGGDQPKVLELSRRLELQADCFSAMFLANAAGRGSIGAGMISQLKQSTFEDSDTHGSAKSAALWQKRGLTAKDTSACNTFAAPANEVS
ncbi:neutral zinc metallopeptidase [Amycolatopsis azurea]|uniref:YpfJ protein, zinc metalloprotease superfamily n=1 Tax=Amycolatopsis azurea DSM 43854 TaxID=1238180 RepID=M2QSX5_9PSEU|nr:neutral zinc metallopeptidase [Amycolatopsis azurea]EMD29112.1 YpfJ protein, zinc metalloprotease superfamily [Amycolatopsis azurea DSM 43854]OOC05126.1 YpfJ protein, zinc metalloprotease superfamily [Amycolatopsis azurea DSM 43854]